MICITPSSAANIGEEDWVKILATGYDADGNETGTLEFYLVNGPDNIITEYENRFLKLGQPIYCLTALPPQN